MNQIGSFSNTPQWIVKFVGSKLYFTAPNWREKGFKAVMFRPIKFKVQGQQCSASLNLRVNKPAYTGKDFQLNGFNTTTVKGAVSFDCEKGISCYIPYTGRFEFGI